MTTPRLTVVMVSHDLFIVSKFVDKVICVKGTVDVHRTEEVDEELAGLHGTKVLWEAGLLDQDRRFVLKKLELTEGEFAEIMSAPARSFWDYPSYRRHPVFRSRRVLSLYRRVKGAGT